MGLGFVVGPLIGGAFGEWSLRAPFVAAAVMNALKPGAGVVRCPSPTSTARRWS